MSHVNKRPDTDPTIANLPRYDRRKSYAWNYAHPPDPVDLPEPPVAGEWQFCGLPALSPLGAPAGPMLNGRWCLYYASLGFDVVTYKTVRSQSRACYPPPNLQPVACGPLTGGEREVAACDEMLGSWAVSYGMPSQPPEVWRSDVERTRRLLPPGKLLVVSVVATPDEDWSLDQVADDYARCAKWAVESGADVVETNFSCPNVATCDGQLFQNAEDSGIVAARVRDAVGETPFIVKIGHLPEAGQTSLLLELQDRADAVATTNSIAARVTTSAGQQLFDGQPRGICGAAILDASVAQVTSICRLIRHSGYGLKVVGVGGAGDLRGVQRYLAAGAQAVHLATAAMVDPGVALHIRRQWSGEAD